MTIPRLLAATALLALAACDPSYTLHLTTHVREGNAAVPRAWVVPLTFRNGGEGVVRTDGAGDATSTRRTFLHNPIDDSLAVEVEGKPLCVVRAGPDVELHGHGLVYVTEYDAEMTVDLAGPACRGIRRVPLACDAGQCTVAVARAANDSCQGFLVTADESRASATLVDESAETLRQAGEGRWRFAQPAGRAAFAVGCFDASGTFVVTVAQ